MIRLISAAPREEVANRRSRATTVGRVHLGVVFSADARGRSIAVRETHKLSGEFVAPAEVTRGYDRLETCSQLLFDHIRESV